MKKLISPLYFRIFALILSIVGFVLMENGVVFGTLLVVVGLFSLLGSFLKLIEKKLDKKELSLFHVLLLAIVLYAVGNLIGQNTLEAKLIGGIIGSGGFICLLFVIIKFLQPSKKK